MCVYLCLAQLLSLLIKVRNPWISKEWPEMSNPPPSRAVVVTFFVRLGMPSIIATGHLVAPWRPAARGANSGGQRQKNLLTALET